VSAPHTDNAAGRARGGQVVHLPLLHLVIPGAPVSQGNPQYFGPHRTAYPKATRGHRALVEALLGEHWAGQPPIDQPVALHCDFHFTRPASHYGTGRNSKLLKDSAPIWHAQQPDADKLCRLVMDSLTHAAVWRDDKLASRITGDKHWSHPSLGPRTEITILRRDPMDITEGAHALLVKCPECGREVNFPIEVSGRLTVDSLNGGRLKPVVSTKSLEHTCNGESQQEMDFEGDE
jgi:Holliday junction resolvase RusA-like endonuclease